MPYFQNPIYGICKKNTYFIYSDYTINSYRNAADTFFHRYTVGSQQCPNIKEGYTVSVRWLGV